MLPIKRCIKIIIGILLILIGIYLVLFEIGMSISETSLLKHFDTIFFFTLFIVLGIGSILLGIKLIK